MQLGLKDIFVIGVVLFSVFIIVLAGVGAAIFFSPCRGQVETKVVEKCTPAVPAPMQQAEPQIIYREKECPPCQGAIKLSPPSITKKMSHDEMMCLMQWAYPNAIMYNIMAEDKNGAYSLTTRAEMTIFMKAIRAKMMALTVDQAAYGSTGILKTMPGWEKIAWGMAKTRHQFLNVYVTYDPGDPKPKVWSYAFDTDNPDDLSLEEAVPFTDPERTKGMCINM